MLLLCNLIGASFCFRFICNFHRKSDVVFITDFLLGKIKVEWTKTINIKSRCNTNVLYIFCIGGSKDSAHGTW